MNTSATRYHDEWQSLCPRCSPCKKSSSSPAQKAYACAPLGCQWHHRAPVHAHWATHGSQPTCCHSWWARCCCPLPKVQTICIRMRLRMLLRMLLRMRLRMCVRMCVRMLLRMRLRMRVRMRLRMLLKNALKDAAGENSSHLGRFQWRNLDYS